MKLPILTKNKVQYKGAICKKDRLLESLIRKALHDFKMIEPDQKKIGIALSGGKDSLTLASHLALISGRGFAKFEIHAFMVTGPFSCGPAVQVQQAQEMCHSLNIDLTLIDSGIKRLTNCYSCSRSRRALIFRAAKERGIEKIAFGHHRDDSIQTLLMNMLHKAEFCPNLPVVPMHKFDITILRPLIYVAEDDIISFARRHGFLKILCQCPIGSKSKRRDVKDLIEMMQESFPNAKKNLSLIALKHGDDKAIKV